MGTVIERNIEGLVFKFELNQVLALRAYVTKDRRPEECLPERLFKGEIGWFLKSGRRVYPDNNICDLHETKGDEQVSRPLAKIFLIESIHFSEDGKSWTRGKYEIREVYGS